MAVASKDAPGLVVSAPAEDVRQVLGVALTGTQRRSVRIVPSKASPFAAAARRDAELVRVVVEFIGSAIGGGVIYDLARAALVKAFGAGRVKAESSKPKTKRPAKARRKAARPTKKGKRSKRR